MPYVIDSAAARPRGSARPISLIALSKRRFMSVTEYLKLVEAKLLPVAYNEQNSYFNQATFVSRYKQLMDLPISSGLSYVDKRFPCDDVLLDLQVGRIADKHARLTALMQDVWMGCDLYYKNIASVPYNIKSVFKAMHSVVLEIRQLAFKEPNTVIGVYDRALYETSFALVWQDTMKLED